MKTDVLVIGAGLAGLACALGSGDASVILVNDTQPADDVASAWAQGGLAAALGADDSPALHASDTLAAAGGIADAPTVLNLTADAPAAIALLERFGVPFDRREDGSLALGLEAAHSRRRIVHAADHTGAAVVRSLLDAVAARPSISLLTGLRSIELLAARDGRITGAAFIDRSGAVVRIDAGAVVLACGGYGGLFARTTTPPATLGAGLAMAGRAGATLADLEFVQFHPTALAAAADPLALVSEAVRGEGAVLVDDFGERFVDELAARDIVARAIFALEERGGRAFLDARNALGQRFAARFPTIARRCAAIGIDPAIDPIPVTPAAHYTIGGIATDANGRTDLPGLWACGEVAATGLHGANRLASNSLMEALIFGTRAARDIAGEAPARRAPAVRALHSASVALVDDLPGALAAAAARDERLRRCRPRCGRAAAGSGLLRAVRALAGLCRSAPARRGRRRARRRCCCARAARKPRLALPARFQRCRRPSRFADVRHRCARRDRDDVVIDFALDDFLRAALREDLGRAGDLTTDAIVPANRRGSAAIVAREAGSISGLAAAARVFALLDPAVVIEAFVADGSQVAAGTRLATVNGALRTILTGERTALNVLGRLCGVATATRRYVALVAGTKAVIVDTRKTTPGMRALEKAAVRHGGGKNHRFGLDDAILIKDNHVAVAGGVVPAIEAARAAAGHLVTIEVEVDALDQLDAALGAGAHIVLLDNFAPALLAEAVRRTAGRALLEASGGVNASTVRAIAESGVDLISIGALTHSTVSLDVALDVDP